MDIPAENDHKETQSPNTFSLPSFPINRLHRQTVIIHKRTQKLMMYVIKEPVCLPLSGSIYPCAEAGTLINSSTRQSLAPSSVCKRPSIGQSQLASGSRTGLLLPLEIFPILLLGESKAEDA